MKSYEQNILYFLAPAEVGPPVPYSTTETINMASGEPVVRTVEQPGHVRISEAEFVAAVEARDSWVKTRVRTLEPKEADDG